MAETNTTSESSQHHHHHHHHHHHKDASEIFKNKNLQAKRRRDFIEKWLFNLLIVLAVLVMIGVVVVYIGT